MKIKLPAKKEKPKKSTSRDILYGMGLTKRVAKAANKTSPLTALSKKCDLSPLLKKVKQDVEITLPQGAKITEEPEDDLPVSFTSKDLVLDTYQQEASKKLRTEKYGIIVGKAGVGKTTALKALIEQLQKVLPKTSVSVDEIFVEALDIRFVAFMGKAVQPIKHALPLQYQSLCSTIHALLEFEPCIDEVINKETGDIESKWQFLPKRDKANPLTCQCLIIDEAGSLQVTLWNQLIDALPSTCRVYMLGDLNQLVPVAGHSILGFAMLQWPTYELLKLHRNAGEIAEQAHRVTNGLIPKTDAKNQRVIMKEIGDGSLTARREILAVIRHLYETDRFDPKQDAIIVPQNVGAIGQLELNLTLVNLFNAPKFENSVCKNPRTVIRSGFETRSFAVGDKVMLLKNNNEHGLTNGMTGIITSITLNAKFRNATEITATEIADLQIDLEEVKDAYEAEIAKETVDALEEIDRASSHVITVHFLEVDIEKTFATAGEVNTLTLAYVFTCHKAQGSEYRTCIVVCHSAASRMLCREWLYTAMTRAKSRLLILHNDRGIRQAVRNQRIKGTTLKEKAEKFIALQKGISQKAILPEAEHIEDGQFTFTSKQREV